MSMGLTKVQADTLQFIKARIESNGVGPSYDEIAAELHLKSRGNITRIITGLVERGALCRLPGKARALSLPADSGFFLSPHPEVSRAMHAYAKENGISIETAAHEALRNYFVGASAE